MKIAGLSPAKLNLFLHVTGQQSNGYHTLQTAFQLLDWGDSMTFERRDLPGLSVSPSIPNVADADNLIHRAAALLGETRFGANITIDKQIPMGGGLGGGSSNAATTLLALNELWELNYSLEELAALGVTLGADVPVFVRGCSAWAEGIGEDLAPFALPEQWFVIIHPGCNVSTAEIFAAPELTRNTPAITMSAFFEGQTHNDLQAVVVERFPSVRNALNWLGNFAPARMTGSGACVFAALDSRDAAESILRQCPDDFKGFVAKGVNNRPTLNTTVN